ncbi:response regulator transcription factor [uncultured Bacteroides sp.]|uniref:response regulator n=1 Tax=uncultured Bacteroides sp. TaxID=162156 RepID=UPI0026396B05|nr:response regulator transcription factor [uncultured Bacteroides sp.]
MNEGKSNILLVDDHALILQGMKHLIQQMPEIGNVSTASTGKEAVHIINSQPFDLYMLDLELPDMTGFELIEVIRKKKPQARILISTMHEEIWTIKRLIQNNIDGAVLKSTDTFELKLAIQKIMGGETYFCRRFERILQRSNNSKVESSVKDRLTQREIEVLKAIAQGLNTREIAEFFHVSSNTIESHRKNLMIKLEAKNAVDLVLKAINYGIISIDNKL